MVGQQIGDFQILQKLGEGGMGVVYEALDVSLERRVAIKMLAAGLADNPELLQRFQSEARAQANLIHTNVATLYAFLVDQGNAFMVMEYVEGETFEQIIRRNGPITPRDAIPWFKQALLGIGAAHRMGIIHRDIKPSNLMLNRDGIVKVMDFGIAKAVATQGITRTGMQLGTPLYMSPEQIQKRNVDSRSDIYALGITLYEMLSGHVPFESDSDFQIMHDQVNTPPPPMTRYFPYAPRELDGVVEKALAKNPNDRFQNVEEFGAALEHPANPAAIASPVFTAQSPLERLGAWLKIGRSKSPAVAPAGNPPMVAAPAATRLDASAPQPAVGYGRIQFISGALSGRTFPITKEGLWIGRDPKCAIVLQDDSVSGHHAWVVPAEGGSIVVIDTGSTNGTYVNSLDSPRISKVGLRNGDRIFLGHKGSTFTYLVA